MVVGKESKTLLIEDDSAALERIAELLQTLDAKPRQVLIEAKILEVTLSDGYQQGINWSNLSFDDGAVVMMVFV